MFEELVIARLLTALAPLIVTFAPVTARLATDIAPVDDVVTFPVVITFTVETFAGDIAAEKFTVPLVVPIRKFVAVMRSSSASVSASRDALSAPPKSIFLDDVRGVIVTLPDVFAIPAFNAN